AGRAGPRADRLTLHHHRPTGVTEMPSVPRSVALIGAGVIGRGWIRVFAAHEVEVRLHDRDPEQLRRTLEWLDRDLAADVADGLVSAEERATTLEHVRGEADLAAALAGTDYVQ